MTDFELVDSGSNPASTALQRLEWFFRNPRRWVEQWTKNPPHSFGFVIFLVVVMELVLSRRLAHSLGTGPDVLQQFFKTALIIFVIEVVIAKIGQETARSNSKDGDLFNTITLFNICLTPLLLFLPLTLVSVAGHKTAFRTTLFLLLALKVAADWRGVMERSYGLTKRQSLYAFGGVFILAYVAAFTFLSLMALDTLADILS